jgi:hypothetical protein
MGAVARLLRALASEVVWHLYVFTTGSATLCGQIVFSLHIGVLCISITVIVS